MKSCTPQNTTQPYTTSNPNNLKLQHNVQLCTTLDVNLAFKLNHISCCSASLPAACGAQQKNSHQARRRNKQLLASRASAASARRRFEPHNRLYPQTAVLEFEGRFFPPWFFCPHQVFWRYFFVVSGFLVGHLQRCHKLCFGCISGVNDTEVLFLHVTHPLICTFRSRNVLNDVLLFGVLCNVSSRKRERRSSSRGRKHTCRSCSTRDRKKKHEAQQHSSKPTVWSSSA